MSATYLAIIYLAILLLKALLSWRYIALHPETEQAYDSMTVLQPILGGDPFLETALQKNLEIVSSNTRFIWLVDETDKIGQNITAKLTEKSPDSIQVVICPPCPAESNPKLWKLHLALSQVDTEFIAVLDDDTMLNPGQLEKAVSALGSCDLYTGLPNYQASGGFWSSLLAHFVNNNSKMTYLPMLNWREPITLNGMFYVMRTETLNRYGGFTPILNELCDDYALAKFIKQQKGNIYQGIASQTLHTTVESPTQYRRMMHRWFVFANLLVRDQSFVTQSLLILLLGFPALLLWGIVLFLPDGLMGCLALAFVLLIRHVLIVLLHRKVFQPRPRFSFFISILAELGQVVHYIHACCSSVILWRTHKIKVHKNGKFSYLEEES